MRALLIGSVLVLAACPHARPPAPTPAPPATPTPTPTPTRCDAVTQILAAAADGFASLRGEVLPGSEAEAQAWGSTLAMPGATEIDVTLVRGVARWTATFPLDDVPFEVLDDELGACDAVAALSPDEPLDDDDDGAIDVMAWLAQDGTTVELTRGPGVTWLTLAAH